MDHQLLRNLKVVIEVFDDDFGKDDYIGGVKFSLSSFHWDSEYEATLSLFSARHDGFAVELYNVAQYFSSRSIKPVPAPYPTDDLEIHHGEAIHDSNIKLVEYMGNMRILEDAWNIRQSMPLEVNLQESVRSSQNVEVQKEFEMFLGPILGGVKDKVRLARDELERLRERNRQLKANYEDKERLLADKDRAIWALEGDLVNIRGKCSMLEYEYVRIKELEQGYDTEREYYIEQIAVARGLIKDIDVNYYKREIERNEAELQHKVEVVEKETLRKSASKIKIPISVFSEFKRRMLAELEARRSDYLKSVGNLNLETKLIMAKYDEIVLARERSTIDAEQRSANYGRMEMFRAEMGGIEAELAKLRAELANKQGEFARQKTDHEYQLDLKRQEFNSFRRKFEEDIQAWLARHKAEYNLWSKEQLELTIYEKLLEFEDKRFGATRPSVGAARVSTEKRTSRYGTGPVVQQHSEGKYTYYSGRSSVASSSGTYVGGGSSAGTYLTGGGGYQHGTVTTTTYKSRKESGYHSPAAISQVTSPAGTLGRDSTYSNVFNNIRSEMSSDSELHI